jgi:hypothetical protein
MDEKVAAAVEAVKGSLSSFGDHPYQAVNSGLAINTLSRELGIDRDEAKRLCITAVEDHLSGYTTTREYKNGLRGGLPPARHIADEWWVARGKL